MAASGQSDCWKDYCLFSDNPGRGTEHGTCGPLNMVTDIGNDSFPVLTTGLRYKSKIKAVR